MAAVTSVPSADVPKSATAVPQRPDRTKFAEDVAEADKALKTITDRLDELTKHIAEARSGTSSLESDLKEQLVPIEARLTELVGDHRVTRDKIKQLESKVKQHQDNTVSVSGQTQYNSSQELDSEIERLQGDIDSQKMRLVEERQAKDKIGLLNRLRPGLTKLEDLTNQVETLKESLQKGKDTPEVKDLRSQERAISDKLTQATKDRQARQKKLEEMQEQRKQIQSDQRAKRNELRKLKDDFYADQRVYQTFQEGVQKIRKERYAAEKQAQDIQQRLEEAKAVLADSVLPAHHEKIVAAKSLVRLLDPNAIDKEEEGVIIPSKPKVGGPQVLRTITDTEVKGRRLGKNDNENEWYMGTGGNKSKSKAGNKKISHAASSSAGYNLDIGVIQQFAKLDIDPPSSQAEVAGVVATLRQKIETWRKSQEQETKEIVDKVKKDIAVLEEKALAADAVVSKGGSRDSTDETRPVVDSENTDPIAADE